MGRVKQTSLISCTDKYCFAEDHYDVVEDFDSDTELHLIVNREGVFQDKTIGKITLISSLNKDACFKIIGK